ncbi:MAG: leucyl/phenylalanyl-tRNA--protein transferase [Myxococcota bacterium]|nr:leucyl/phenylalanyl-tRNA--protein transferase [Myxococcota bacterium]
MKKPSSPHKFAQKASVFPPPSSADEYGLVAITWELNSDLLYDAYQHGIFPWSENPVCWFSPDKRAIFPWDRVKIPKKLQKQARKAGLRVTYDLAFREVIQGCSDSHRHQGEWISPGFVRSYTQLHQRGHAHSVEVWQNEQLVGGLYGVQVQGLFAGESMFFRVPNASKLAFSALLAKLIHIGCPLIDAQVLNDHTEQLGAVEIPRADYLQLLHYALNVRPTENSATWSTPFKDLDALFGFLKPNLNKFPKS